MPYHFVGQDERYKEEMDEYNADARLIAAAPQLLEALKYIANEDVDPWITQICVEAISAADGEPAPDN